MTATWISEVPSVLSLDARGRAIARAPGQARVTASVGQTRASLSLRVIPQYGRTWTGPAEISACKNYNFRTCPRSSPEGSKGTLVLRLVQEGLGLTGALEVTYFVEKTPEGLSFHTTTIAKVSGTILDDDHLLLMGTMGVRGPDGSDFYPQEPTWLLRYWTSNLADQQLTGSFEREYFYADMDNFVRWTFGPLMSNTALKGPS